MKFIGLALVNLALCACSGALPILPEHTPVCGDGQMNSGEACDDGNLISSDSCTELCQSARCGDGFVRLDLPIEDEEFEQCEAAESALCDEHCRWRLRLSLSNYDGLYQ